MQLPRVALTVGDPAGIGPEIVAAAAADPRVLAVCEPLTYAPPDVGRFTPGQVSAEAGQAEVPQRLTMAKALIGTKPERTRDELAVVLRVAASMLRDLEAINAQADPRVLANADLRDHLDRLARAYTGDRARRAFTAVDRALLALNRNASTKVVAEWLETQI